MKRPALVLLLFASVANATDVRLDLPGTVWHGWPVVDQSDGWARVQVPPDYHIENRHGYRRGDIRVILTKEIHYRSRTVRQHWIIENLNP